MGIFTLEFRFFRICSKNWTRYWMLSGLNLNTSPSWQSWKTKSFHKRSKYTTKDQWSDISCDKQLCQTHSGYTQAAPTRLHWVTPACRVSSCFKEGQGQSYVNYNPDCSWARSEVWLICTVCSFLFKLTASLNSHKSERLLHDASQHSHNTLALTFDPTTG